MIYTYSYLSVIKPVITGVFSPLDLPNTQFYSDPTIQSSVNTRVAASFVSANSEKLFISSPSDFTKGKEDFSFGCWSKNTLGGTDEPIISQYNSAGGNRSYLLRYESATKVAFYMTFNGSTLKSRIDAVNVISGDWNFITCVYDSVAELMKISVNGVTYLTTVNADGANSSSTADFAISNRDSGTFGDIVVDATFFYDKALSQSESDALYNSGNGIDFIDLTAAQKVDLVEWWRMNELSGNRSGELGHTLTDSNTVDFTLGKVGEEVSAGNLVYTLGDLAPSANTGVQGTLDNQSVWNTSHITYATNDFINIDAVLTDIASTANGTQGLWVNPVDATPISEEVLMSWGDTSADEYISISITTTGLLRAICVIAGVTQWDLDTDSTVFSNGVWAYPTITHNGTTPVLYLDNVAVATTFTTDTNKAKWLTDLTGVDNGRLGCLNKNAGGDTNFFNGDIQQVYISTDVKSASVLTQLFNINQP